MVESDHIGKTSKKTLARIGEIVGRLKLIGWTNERHPEHYQCLCLDCGSITLVQRTSLHPNRTCRLCTKMGRKIDLSSAKHKPEYSVWKQMRGRCSNPNANGWDRYGGRGIRVCQRWQSSFANFYADMGPRSSPQHSLDRINNEGNYEPGNCRWATRCEQMRNTRSNVRLTFGGETLSMAEWKEKTGLTYATIRNRHSRGWDVQRLLTESSHGNYLTRR